MATPDEVRTALGVVVARGLDDKLVADAAAVLGAALVRLRAIADAAAAVSALMAEDAALLGFTPPLVFLDLQEALDAYTRERA